MWAWAVMSRRAAGQKLCGKFANAHRTTEQRQVLDSSHPDDCAIARAILGLQEGGQQPRLRFQCERALTRLDHLAVQVVALARALADTSKHGETTWHAIMCRAGGVQSAVHRCTVPCVRALFGQPAGRLCSARRPMPTPWQRALQAAAAGRTVRLGDVVDQLHDEHSLADTRTAKQADLATPLVGRQ